MSLQRHFSSSPSPSLHLILHPSLPFLPLHPPSLTHSLNPSIHHPFPLFSPLRVTEWNGAITRLCSPHLTRHSLIPSQSCAPPSTGHSLTRCPFPSQATAASFGRRPCSIWTALTPTTAYCYLDCITNRCPPKLLLYDDALQGFCRPRRPSSFPRILHHRRQRVSADAEQRKPATFSAARA